MVDACDPGIGEGGTTMAGIAGISAPGRQATVEEMLEKMSHRGGWGREVAEVAGTTPGVV